MESHKGNNSRYSYIGNRENSEKEQKKEGGRERKTLSVARQRGDTKRGGGMREGREDYTKKKGSGRSLTQ